MTIDEDMPNIRPFLLISLVLASAFSASCGSENSDPVTSFPQANGGLTVSALVPDGGVQGVQIQITGPESKTGSTNALGIVVFAGIAPGSYTVAITSAPATVEFTRTSQTVSVPAGGTASVSFLGVELGGS